jgi:RNA polymerase sigma factor (sigma-70 family)
MEYRNANAAAGDNLMSIRLSKETCESIHALFHWGAMGTWTDSQLIAQFLGEQEASEPAFRVLIHRHGPMVLGICRRVLGDEHAAEDAFQATFLIFVQKAARLRDRTLLSNWLYGVAHRVAQKERAKGARRRAVERQAVDKAPEYHEDAAQAELRTVIDEEIHRLPERYRLPLVLCHLEGLRHDEAAQQLGCPIGTIESRLARGRERLRERLVRRGLAPSASAFVAATRPQSAPEIFTTLVDATLKAASKLLSNQAVTGTTWMPYWSLMMVKCFRGFGRALAAETAASTMILCGAIVTAGVGLYRANGSPEQNVAPPNAPPASRERAAEPTAPSPNPAPEPSRPIASPPATVADADRDRSVPPAPKRFPHAIARPLEGISIDGCLNDWPNDLTRYPIQNQLLSHPSYDGDRKNTADDPSAYFMAGYDRQKELIYLAVVVRDRDVVTHSRDVLATDAVEIYIDGTFSDHTIPEPIGDWWEHLDAARMPVLQYAAVPASIPAYRDKARRNPSLVYGKISRTTTAMKFVRAGDVTTYEWAVQAFDHYPDRPSRLRPGRRLGLEVAVLDKDPHQDRSVFLTWGTPPRVFKGFDAGSLGELVLAAGPKD